LAVEVEASSESNRAWVGVYPLNGARAREEAESLLRRFHVTALPTAYVYRLRFIEVSVSLLVSEVSISEEEIVQSRDRVAVSDDDLVRVLEEEGLQVEAFDHPYKCEYPI
jgi:hypothetical protein